MVDRWFLWVEILIVYVDICMYSVGVWGRECEYVWKVFGCELIFVFCS